MNGISTAVNATIDIGSVQGCSGVTCGDYKKANAELAKQLGVPYRDFQNDRVDGVRYVWHHHQDCKTMMLVPFAINDKVTHPGGRSVSNAIGELKNIFSDLNIEAAGALPSPSIMSTCN